MLLGQLIYKVCTLVCYHLTRIFNISCDKLILPGLFIYRFILELQPFDNKSSGFKERD